MQRLSSRLQGRAEDGDQEHRPAESVSEAERGRAQRTLPSEAPFL